MVEVIHIAEECMQAFTPQIALKTRLCINHSALLDIIFDAVKLTAIQI